MALGIGLVLTAEILIPKLMKDNLFLTEDEIVYIK